MELLDEPPARPDAQDADLPARGGAAAEGAGSDIEQPAGAPAAPAADAGSLAAPDVPARDVPAADVPAADALVADVPAADVPVADAAVADAPVADAPVADAPVADAPVADAPAVDAPAADAPAVDAPAVDVPVADVPAADVPAADAAPAGETAEPAPAAARTAGKPRDGVDRLGRVCGAAEAAAASDKLELPVAERHLRAVRRALDEMQAADAGSSAPPRRARAALARRLRRVQTALLGRVRELRDFADWQRWANLGVQEDLCAELEALAGVEDDSQLAARYRNVMGRWRQAADVPKERGEQLRARFEAAHEKVYGRCQKYLAAQAADREHNLARRLALVEEAERLASSTDWLRTVQRITELQAEWKQIGPVPRRQQQETWDRFRAACGTFFTRRKNDLAQRKQEWAQNLERKEALIARVEALEAETDIPAAVAQARQAQAEWKQVGAVQRKRSDAIWQRFRAACDAVFSRAQAAEHEAAADKIEAREALCRELEALPPADDPAGEAPEGLADRVRDLQQQWRQAADLPHALRRKLAARFGQAISRVVAAYPAAFRGTELDPARQLARLDELCRRVESLIVKEIEPEASPAEILATRWRDALASNLMGARVDEGARRRAAIEQVKRLQAERRKLGQLPGPEGQRLAERFQQACDRLFDAGGR